MITTNNDISLLNNTSAALGAFDGVHKAHRALIAKTVECARNNGAKSAVFTFDRNPSNSKRIVSIAERNEIISRMGTDVLFVCPFGGEIKNMQPFDFLEKYLKNCFCISVGFNFRFGKDRQGTTDDIQSFCKQKGILCNIMEPVYDGGEIVSSTLIRKYISNCDFDRARNLLGQNYSVCGVVVHGDKIGRKMGFPTLNIEQRDLLVPNGVYASAVIIDGVQYMGVTNVGGKPTVRDGVNRVETYAVNYSGCAYGKKIRVEFIKRLRDTVRFDTIEQLKGQLSADVSSVLKIGGIN